MFSFVFLCICTCACGCLQKPEEDVVSLEVGVAGGCEPSDRGAGKQTAELCRAANTLTAEASLSWYFFLFDAAVCIQFDVFPFGEERPENRNLL